jgi:hypothetical protein
MSEADSTTATPEPSAAPEPARPTAAALIEEATKKSGMAWITVPGSDRARAVWHAWQDGAAYVLSGPSEQPLPGIEDAPHVEVTIRSKDKQHRLIVWEAAVNEVLPGTDDWAAVTPTLLGKRLNLPDGEAAVDRWARECHLHKLTPTGTVLEDPDSRTSDTHAAPPAPSPATTKPARPWHLGDRRRRNVR